MINQFGFRTGYSTEMAITDLIDKVCKAVDQNETTLGIYLDLSKAFDTINHDILLYKLEHYTFRGICLEWFKSYLSDRTQYVYYNSNKSCIENVTCFIVSNLSYLQMTQLYCIPIKILLTKSWWLIMTCKKLRIGSKPTNFQLMLTRPILSLWAHHKKHSNSWTI